MYSCNMKMVINSRKLLQMDNTVWKDIPEYEGLYQAGNDGRIKSLKCHTERILKPSITKSGYLQVALRKNNTTKSYYVHRLVWEAFNGTVPIGYEVNHIDENKLNAKLSNLNLLTRSENCCWGTYRERWINTRSRLGYINKVMSVDKNGNINKEYISYREAERDVGASKCTITHYVNKNIMYKGYYWVKLN